MSAPPREPSRFWPGMWHGCSPLLIWASHFFGCYIAVAWGCDQHWGQDVWLGLSRLRWALLLFSVAAAAWLGMLTLSSLKQAGKVPGGMLDRVRLVVAGLSLMAMLWTTVPLLWLPACHFA